MADMPCQVSSIRIFSHYASASHEHGDSEGLCGSSASRHLSCSIHTPHKIQLYRPFSIPEYEELNQYYVPPAKFVRCRALR